MEEKIICPWCGAEMEARAYKNRSNAIGWTKCQNIDCGADGPIVTGKTAVECADKARAAARRRYTPPLKPTKNESRCRK